MIRSIRSIRSMGCDTCPIVPGKPGPVEPFHPRCFGDSPEVWSSIDSYLERAFRWDMGGVDGREVTPSAVEEALSLAHWIIFTTTPQQWHKCGIGYGDRMRALQLVRGRLRRMHWRDRQTATGTRRENRRYRSYRASMSVQEPSPVSIAIAVEEASRRGVRGRRPGAGRPTMETRNVTREEAHTAIMGEPVREVVVGPIAVSGGVAHVETDGQLREVELRSVAFTFHTGSRGEGGRWVPDGGVERLEEVETAFRMVGSTTRVDYPRTFVAEAVDAGTELNRHMPTATPSAAPWGLIRREWTPTYVPDLEYYRAQLAAARADKPLAVDGCRRARIMARWARRRLLRETV